MKHIGVSLLTSQHRIDGWEYYQLFQVVTEEWETDEVFAAYWKKQSRAHAFHATFFKSSLKSHHAALECINNQNI